MSNEKRDSKAVLQYDMQEEHESAAGSEKITAKDDKRVQMAQDGKCVQITKYGKRPQIIKGGRRVQTAKGDASGTQMSEAFINSVFLALSGGFQDAYTYNTRDKVFANAQTGNIVLMSQHMMLGEWFAGLRYLLPLFAFAAGVLAAENFQNRFKFARKIHWRQSILLFEIAILFAVGFMGKPFNIVASALVSFACAMQVQSFRKVGGFPYASTMCIGNLRSGTEALSMYLREKKLSHLRQAMYYFGVIFFFAIGAGIGGVFSLKYGIRSIWMSCGLLFVSVLLMSLEKLM